MSIDYFEKKEPKRRIKIKRNPYLLSEEERQIKKLRNKTNRKESIEQNLEENDSE